MAVNKEDLISRATAKLKASAKTGDNVKKSKTSLANRAKDILTTADNIRSNNDGSAMGQWRADNADRIAGIANANNVDMSVAESMLKSNIQNGTNYAGGGVANMQELQAGLNRAQAGKAQEDAQRRNSAATDYYDRIYQQQRKILQDQINNSLNQINSYRDAAKQDYEAQQREAYIANQKAQNELGDYLVARGINGGLAETTAQGLAADYLNRRAEANQNYNDVLNSINQMYAEAQASGNANLANLAISLYENYANTARENAAREAEQARWQAEYDMAMGQYENSLAQQDYENRLKQAQIAAQYGDYSLLNDLLGTSIQPVPVYSGGGSSSSKNQTRNLGREGGLSSNERNFRSTVSSMRQGEHGGNKNTTAEQPSFNAANIAASLFRLNGGDITNAATILRGSNYSDSQKEAILSAFRRML